MLNKRELFADNDLYKLRINPQYIYSYSLSKIGIYRKCSLQYFFRYCTDYEIKPTVWPVTLFGESIHYVVETVINQRNQNVSLKQILKELKNNEIFTQKFDELLIKHKKYFKKSKDYTYPKYIKKGLDFSSILANFIFKYFEGHTLFPEKSFKSDFFKFNDQMISLNGKTDLLSVFNDEYSIYDFKFTKYNEQFYVIDWEQDNQSIIYNYLVKHDIELQKDIKKFGYIVTNHVDPILFVKEYKYSQDYRDNELQQSFLNLKNEIKKIAEFTENLEFLEDEHQKVSSKDCYWCSYKEICPYNKK